MTNRNDIRELTGAALASLFAGFALLSTAGDVEPPYTFRGVLRSHFEYADHAATCAAEEAGSL